MIDDEKVERIAIVMGTGAGGIRAVTGDDSPATVTDAVAIPPDLIGQYGRAWRCDLAAGLAKMKIDPALNATLVHWVIEAPFAHPVWHSYSIVLVHLHPTPHIQETKIFLDGATHEMWVYAMNPDIPRTDLIRTGIVKYHWMQPINFAAQFIEVRDKLALDRIQSTVREIIEGRLSPDTDYQSDWVKLFGDNMVKAEYR